MIQTKMATNNSKRRILIFSTAYYPFVGGAEVAIKEITDRLGNDFDFDLITARLQKNSPKFEKIGNVNVYRTGVGRVVLDKLILPFVGVRLVSKLYKQNNYFCFWAMMVTFGSGAGFLYNIFRKLSGRKKIPIILTLQEGDSESHLKYKWAGLIALSWKLALWQTDFLTGISNFLLNKAKRNGYKKKVFLVPNGVDVRIFSQKIEDKTKIEIKKSLAKKEGDVFLVTSGRLARKNAIDDIISALTLLPENISLLIIGKGDEGPNLQKQAKELKVSDRVKFLGFLPYKDIPKYLSVCDIFIRPSRSEGFGNSFIEAMAASLPVIATPVGGIPDFVDDKETGFFASPDNPQSIKVAVMTLLNDKTLRDNIVQKAQNRVLGGYSWDRIANQMGAVFDRI